VPSSFISQNHVLRSLDACVWRRSQIWLDWSCRCWMSVKACSCRADTLWDHGTNLFNYLGAGISSSPAETRAHCARYGRSCHSRGCFGERDPLTASHDREERRDWSTVSHAHTPFYHLPHQFLRRSCHYWLYSGFAPSSRDSHSPSGPPGSATHTSICGEQRAGAEHITQQVTLGAWLVKDQARARRSRARALMIKAANRGCSLEGCSVDRSACAGAGGQAFPDFNRTYLYAMRTAVE
jgi:hypothetical protein